MQPRGRPLRIVSCVSERRERGGPTGSWSQSRKVHFTTKTRDTYTRHILHCTTHFVTELNSKSEELLQQLRVILKHRILFPAMATTVNGVTNGKHAIKNGVSNGEHMTSPERKWVRPDRVSRCTWKLGKTKISDSPHCHKQRFVLLTQ